MNKYIIILSLLISETVFGQIIIGKSTSSPASPSVSMEFGNATGGVRGIVLPWVASEASVTTPAAGTIIFDAGVTTQKIKYRNSGLWIDLSSGARTPSTPFVADSNTEIPTAKVVVAANTVNGSADNTSGIVVLADTDRAMLLPRVNAYTDIVNPSAGMMVYVTGVTPHQVAFFNGIEWSFWNGTNAVPTVVSPTTGRVWMDRNLGATQVATATNDANSYGGLYQWGRLTDGHQIRTSTTTTTLSTTDVPGNTNFITNGTAPNDWRSPQNGNLWQGISGTNNPCPNGFRIPTLAEFTAETTITNATTAYSSFLKLPAGGVRSIAGAVSGAGTNGNYHTSTVSGTSTSVYVFTATGSTVARATGASVRCIKN